MRRFFVLVVIAGLFLGLGVAGEVGLNPIPPAEATETTTSATYPVASNIQVSGNSPAEATLTFQPPACNGCYITRIEPDLVYMGDPDPANHPDGTIANFNNNTAHGVWLHHFVVVDSCDINKHILASGNERTIVQYPAGYGYFVPASICPNPNAGIPRWHINYHIHNNTSATRNVAIKLTVTYRTGETLNSLTPVNMDTGLTANEAEFTVPEGYSETHTGSGAPGINVDWVAPSSPTFKGGVIVGMGGHVHDYGISVSAFSNRLNDYICTSVASYGTGSRYLASGGPGTPGHPTSANGITLNQGYHEAGGTPDDRYHIQAMSMCTLTPLQAVLCPGDVIRLHTQYNNTSGFPIFDAMGIMAGSVDENQPDTNTNQVADQCDDNDSDNVLNIQDNCPEWANPTQSLPSWTMPSGDTDCDGYHPTSVFTPRASESTIGTVATKHCATDATFNNEPGADAWPPDFNDNQLVNGSDILSFNGAFAKSTSDPPIILLGNSTPISRFDLNGSGLVNGADILQMNPFFSKRCA
jgi:hypothetical protein